MSKKINLNFFLLKFCPFLASQEFYHKSILKPRFEAGEAEGSRVERPKKFKNKKFKWQFFNFLRQNFDFLIKYMKKIANFTSYIKNLIVLAERRIVLCTHTQNIRSKTYSSPKRLRQYGSRKPVHSQSRPLFASG